MRFIDADDDTNPLRSIFDTERMKNEFLSRFPEFNVVEGSWTTTPLHQLTLTALGKALAYSALASRTNFKAPIEIWVR
jgi:hypothetical protein